MAFDFQEIKGLLTYFTTLHIV